MVSRGIDIDQIGLVINYDVPHDPEDYIHRIGRTARANADGTAITFVSEKEQGKFHRIELFLGYDIPKRELPEGLGDAPVYSPKQGRGGQRNRGGKRGRTGAKNYGKGGKRKPKKNNRGSQSTEISRKPKRHHGRSKSSGKQSGGVEQ